jgi:16S rRNA (uracil1498-N3)-methyltransferase
MPRFFVPKDQVPIITGADAHQIKNVLRLRLSDKLQILDGTGALYHCEIADIEKEKIICRVIETEHLNSERSVKITLAQGLPKGRKMDLIVEKCTEFGVEQIIPITTERAVAKEAKILRWQKIAKEAAEQSGRSTIPEIAPQMHFTDIIKLKTNFDLALIPWELEKETTLKTFLSTHKLPTTNYKILVLVGPEGGFSIPEVANAIKAGFQSVSLGSRILRTETAGLATLAMLNYHFEL